MGLVGEAACLATFLCYVLRHKWMNGTVSTESDLAEGGAVSRLLVRPSRSLRLAVRTRPSQG